MRLPSSSFKNSRPAGFTLVELVIVILILGILSAVALPRFLDLGKDARAAKAEAIHGAVRAAAQITRAAALVRGATAAGPGAVTDDTSRVQLDGVYIQTNHGYPEASVDGIITAAGLNTTTDKITLSGGGANPADTITITVDGGGASCNITYQSPGAVGAAPVITLNANAANC